MIIDLTQTRAERQIEICRRRGWTLASPDTVGAFPIREDITVLPGNSLKIDVDTFNWDEVGIIYINDYEIKRISV